MRHIGLLMMHWTLAPGLLQRGLSAVGGRPCSATDTRRPPSPFIVCNGFRSMGGGQTKGGGATGGWGYSHEPSTVDILQRSHIMPKFERECRASGGPCNTAGGDRIAILTQAQSGMYDDLREAPLIAAL